MSALSFNVRAQVRSEHANMVERSGPIHSRRAAVRFAVIVAALLILAIAPAKAQSIVRIGVIDRMQGPLARGAQLAAKHINESGGLLGANGARYEIIVAVTSPDNMDIATANMRQANVIAVLGPSSPATMREALPILQALDVPVFTTISSDSLLVQDTSGLIFRSVAPESLQSRALAAYLVQSLAASQITSIQLDAASTSSLIGFASALSEFGANLSNHLYEETGNDVVTITDQIAAGQVDAVVMYGPPLLAAQTYLQLRAAGYAGPVSYSQATDPNFVSLVPSDRLRDLIVASPWSYTSSAAASQSFLWAYASMFGALPDAASAASYDAVGLLAQAYRRPGHLADNIAALQHFDGIQGPLTPAELPRGETSTNIVIATFNEYGTANAVDNNRGASQSAAIRTVDAAATPIALPSPSDSVYRLTILSDYQNVRSGPSLNFDVIGLLPGGAQEQVLGATEDFTWLLIDFRGQWGWLASYLVDAVGDRSQVPIILPPPSPQESAEIASSS